MSEEILGMKGRGVDPRLATLEPGETSTIDLRAVRTGTVEGRVSSEDGTPLPHAGISVTTPYPTWQGFRHELRGACDAKGGYRVEGLVPGFPYRVTATGPDGGEGVAEPVRVEAGGTTERDLVVPAARRLEVRVLEEGSGAPLPGARVSVFANERGGTIAPEGRTSGTGRATVGPLPPGPFWIEVSHPDCVAASARIPVPVPDGGGPLPPVEVRLRRGLAIAGRVLVEEGVRVPYWSCTLEAKLVDDGASRFSATAKARHDGTFRIAGLLPGTYEVSVASQFGRPGASPFDPPVLATCRAAAGEEGLLLRIDAASLPDRGTTLRVEVVGADGSPAAAWGLRALGDGGERFSVVFRTRIEFGQDPPASVRLFVHAAVDADGNALGAGLFGPFDASAGTVTIRLPPPRTLEGVVRDGSGAPLRGLLVRAVPLLPGLESHAFVNDGEEARTDADGRFRIGGLADADHRLEVDLPDGYRPPPERTVRAGETGITIMLRRGVSATIRVVGPDGEPVEGAGVSVRGEPQPRTGGRTDASGAATLEGLDPEVRYRLTVVPPRDRTDLFLVSRTDWLPADTTVTLLPAFTVKGVVLGPDGKGCADAWVWYRDGKGRWWAQRKVLEDGTFVLSRLTESPVALRATVAGGAHDAPGVREVLVPGGAENVVLRVDPGESLTVHVANRPERGYVRADLVAEGFVRQGVEKSPGVLRFSGLEAGAEYTLRIVTFLAEDLSLLRSGVRAGAEPLRVTLGPGKSIRGRVALPEGVDRCIVVARLGGLQVNARAAPDGRFEMGGLVEGAWSVHATAFGGGQRWEGEAEARTGETVEIELSLSPRNR